MRCIDNKNSYRKRRNRKKELRNRLLLNLLVVIFIVAGIIIGVNIKKTTHGLVPNRYLTSVHKAETYTENLCVVNEEITFDEFSRQDKFHGALLFDISTQEVLYAEHVHERLYPASTTKMLTIYVALKYGKLNDIVTISKNAVNVPNGSSVAYLKEGDQLSLKDLLYSLMLPSGNDSAVAVAEHISGDVQSFAKLMNQEAKLLGATNTHFVNPHGYHDKDHYTTAYDLYLILNKCLQNEIFVEIVSSNQREAIVKGANGESRPVIWQQTNQFINGLREVPDGVSVIGGKTGNTFEAGSCLAVHCKGKDGTPYIAIIMGASSKRNLYDNMTSLMEAIPVE